MIRRRFDSATAFEPIDAIRSQWIPWRLWMRRLESSSLAEVRAAFITMIEAMGCEVGELLIEIEPLSVDADASSVA